MKLVGGGSKRTNEAGPSTRIPVADTTACLLAVTMCDMSHGALLRSAPHP